MIASGQVWPLYTEFANSCLQVGSRRPKRTDEVKRGFVGCTEQKQWHHCGRCNVVLLILFCFATGRTWFVGRMASGRELLRRCDDLPRNQSVPERNTPLQGPYF